MHWGTHGPTNHRCATIEELVELALAWLDEHGTFKIEGGIYQRLKKRAASGTSGILRFYSRDSARFSVA